MLVGVFFFKQKTAYEMRISDWSSDVCSSDLEDLLLVSAGERGGGAVGVGGPQLEGFDLLARDPALGAFVQEPGLGEPRDGRQGHVDEDRLVEDETLALALFG